MEIKKGMSLNDLHTEVMIAISCLKTDLRHPREINRDLDGLQAVFQKRLDEIISEQDGFSMTGNVLVEGVLDIIDTVRSAKTVFYLPDDQYHGDPCVRAGRDIADLSMAEARRYLGHKLSGCSTCSSDHKLYKGRIFLLDSLVSKLGLDGRIECYTPQELDKYMLSKRLPGGNQAVVEIGMAAHVANCPDCKAYVFDEKRLGSTDKIKKLEHERLMERLMKSK